MESFLEKELKILVVPILYNVFNVLFHVLLQVIYQVIFYLLFDEISIFGKHMFKQILKLTKLYLF